MTSASLDSGIRAPATGRRTFAAFEVVAFRYLWLNSFSFALTQGTQRFAYVWLVLELGGGAGAAGLIAFALGIPVLFVALPAGVLSDRMDRRRLLVVSQVVALVVTALTAVLIWADLVNVGVTFLLAVCLGSTTALGQPVRSAVVPSIIDRERLMNAIVLTTLGMNVSMIIGPALGGGVIALWGLAGAFAFQAGIYALGLLTLIPLRLPPVLGQAARGGREELREAFSFISSHQGIRALFLLLAGSGVFMMGPFAALLPQIARVRLGRSAFGASMLFTAIGAGMMVGSLVLGSLRLTRKGEWFIGALLPGGLLFGAIGLSRSYLLTAALMAVWGFMGGFFMNLNQTLIQSHTPQELMGRVMSIHTLSFMGLAPFGSLLAGGAAGLIGAAEWIVVCGVVLSVMAAFAIVTQPELRRMG